MRFPVAASWQNQRNKDGRPKAPFRSFKNIFETKTPETTDQTRSSIGMTNESPNSSSNQNWQSPINVFKSWVHRQHVFSPAKQRDRSTSVDNTADDLFLPIFNHATTSPTRLNLFSIGSDIGSDIPSLEDEEDDFQPSKRARTHMRRQYENSEMRFPAENSTNTQRLLRLSVQRVADATGVEEPSDYNYIPDNVLFRERQHQGEVRKLVWSFEKLPTTPRTMRNHNVSWLRAFATDKNINSNFYHASARIRYLLKDEEFTRPFLEEHWDSVCPEYLGTYKTDSKEYKALIESVNSFIDTHSSTARNGGTRPKDFQVAVETVLLALIWNRDEVTVNWLVDRFKVSHRTAEKVINMQIEGALSQRSRKKRYDTIKSIAASYVHGYCHDDHCTRADTSNGGRGATYRGFVKVRNDKEEIELHPRRTWPCSTFEEKYARFKTTHYFSELKAEIYRKIPGKRPAILCAERLLRTKLGAPSDKRLLNGDLQKFLNLEDDDRTKRADLIEMLYKEKFGCSVNDIPDDVIHKYVTINEDPLLDIRTFKELLCPCVSNPKVKSCVDTTFTQIQKYMATLANALRFKNAVREQFEKCECRNCQVLKDPERDIDEQPHLLNDYLAGSYYKFLEQTCCPRVPFPSLKNALDNTSPLLVPFMCAERSDGDPVCKKCGVHIKFNNPLSCPVWRDCSVVIQTFEYQEAPRSGLDTHGNNRTQEELLPVNLKFCDVASRLLALVDSKGREHFVHTMWTNKAIRNRGLNPDKNRITCNIDFGATLNLAPLYKKNCHENAHCVDLVMIFHMNPRWVDIRDSNGIFLKKHLIRDTIAVHAFADTISKGKKTDAWMIRRALEEAIMVLTPHFRANDIALKGLDIVSDNCKNQNKCCNYFWHLSTLAEAIATRRFLDNKLAATQKNSETPTMDSLDPKTVEGMQGYDNLQVFKEKFGSILPENWVDPFLFDIRQQYSEPMQGKGGHDGDAAIIKRYVHRREHAMQRSANASGVFRTITEILGKKSGMRTFFPNLAEWEERGDERLLKIFEGTITHRFCFLFSESRTEVDNMRKEGFDHVHYIERNKSILTTSTVPKTNQMKEIFLRRPNLQEEDRTIRWSSQSCACKPCMDLFDSKQCQYKDTRLVSQYTMKPEKQPGSSQGAPRKKTRATTSDEIDQAAQDIHNDPRIQERFGEISRINKKNLKQIAEAFGFRNLPKPSDLLAIWVKFVYDHLFPECPPVDISFLDRNINDNDNTLNNNSQSTRPSAEEDDDDDEGDDCVEELVFGCVAFENFGSVSYLNALFQFLSSSKNLLVTVGKSGADNNDFPLSREFGKTIQQLNSLGSPICLSLCLFKRLFDQVSDGRDNNPAKFALHNQHDPKEFFSCLLDAMDRERGNRHNNLQLRKIFCVPILDGSSIQVSPFVVAEHCNKIFQNVDGLGIVHSPEFDAVLGDVLFVVVGRQVSNSRNVDQRPVAFEEEILTPRGRYQLRATLNRFGHNQNSWHFIAHVQRAIDDDHNRWIRCDDQLCQRVDSNEVFYIQAQKTVYALLYERVDKELNCNVSASEHDLLVEHQALEESAIFADNYLQEMDLHLLSVSSLRLQLEARGVEHNSSNCKSTLASMLQTELQKGRQAIVPSIGRRRD